MGTSKPSGNLTKCWGVTCDGVAFHPGGVAILLVASCYGNRDKLRRCGPLGLCADFFFPKVIAKTKPLGELTTYGDITEIIAIETMQSMLVYKLTPSMYSMNK